MRNVVLLCLDTVRADYFLRHASRLRERADFEFPQCRAASSWSGPSHASMFTGELSSEHGVHAYQRNFSILDESDTIVGDLPDHRAVGVSANVWASSSFGFDELFDEFSDVSPDRRFPEGIDVARFGQECAADGFRKHLAFIRAALTHDHPLYSLANGGLVQLDEIFARLPVPKPMDDGVSIIVREALKQTAGPEPFFQFVNVMDAHGPLRHVLGYDRSLHGAPNTWSSESIHWGDVLENGEEQPVERYRNLYAAAIDYLDRKIDSFVDDLQTRTEHETTVVVTSDHGDNFGTDVDGGLWGHTDSSLSEGLLHVPLLILNAPEECTDSPDSYVSHLALRELMEGIAHDECPDVSRKRIPAERIGHSGKIHNEDERSPEADRTIRCVYEGEEKYEWDSLGNHRRFDLDFDRPSFQHRLNGEGFEVDPLESQFFREDIDTARSRAVVDSSSDEDIDRTTRDRLEDLGYL